MVTVRQFSRGVGRTLRAMERDARRAERQRLLHEKAMAKQAMLDASADAASAYQQLIEILTGSHRVPFKRRDWSAAANKPWPADAERRDTQERAAKTAAESYTPSWFARTFGFEKRQRAQLEKAIIDARSADDSAYRAEQDRIAAQRREIEFAQSVIALKADAVTAVINDHAGLDETGLEGVSILAIGGRVIAVVDGMEFDDMPTQSISLLQSGKASVKPLPRSKALELHRDNLCSSAVTVAAAFLRVLPVDAVEVVVETDLLDPATGHIEPQPVIYLRATAQALENVNLLNAEPAPLAERLGAHMTWSRKDGFRPINIGAFDLPLELLEDA